MMFPHVSTSLCNVLRTPDAGRDAGAAVERHTVNDLAQSLLRVHEVRSMAVDKGPNGQVDPTSLQSYLRELNRVGDRDIGPFAPEIRRYGEYIGQPLQFENQELQRTIAAAGNLGNFLAAAQALADQGPEGPDFHVAYRRFASTQPESSRITEEQFASLSRFFTPLLKDPELARATLVAVVYGDLFKLKEFKETISKLAGMPSDGDHDQLLSAAFEPERLIHLRSLFPSYFSQVAPQYRTAFSEAILNGPNLGHIVQHETRAYVLRDLSALSHRFGDALHIWRCAALADISAAWSVPGNAASWSILIQRPLARALIEFFKATDNFSTDSVQNVAAQFERSLFEFPYYQPFDEVLGSDPSLCLLGKKLSRFFSCETFNLPARELAEEVRKLPDSDKEILKRIFHTSGLDPQSGPGVVVSYLPYFFTQGTLVAYGKERISEAYRCALTIVAQCYRLALESIPANRIGIETFNGQNLWFATKGEIKPGNTALFENLSIAREGNNLVKR